MLVFIQAVIPNTSPAPTVASKNKIIQNWASIQLNIIMLPIGIGLLLIVSLTACICQCLRKRRIKQMQKERRKQQRGNSKKSRNGTFSNHELFSINSQTRKSSSGVSGTEGSRPMSPFVSQPPRFKKEKRKKKERVKSNRGYEKNANEAQKSISGIEKNGIESTTRIPVRVSSKQKKRTGCPEEELPVKYIRHSQKEKTIQEGSFSCSEQNGHVNGELNNDKTELNGIISSKERKKWEIPENSKNERNSSMRLPPLESLRMAKTA